MQIIDKDLLSISEARILSETAKNHQDNLMSYTQVELDKAVAAIFQVIENEGANLITQSVTATNSGDAQDEVKLLQRFLPLWKASLDDHHFVGALEAQGPVHTVGVPLGTVAVIMGIAQPVLNALFGAVSAIKTGNSLVLVPNTQHVKTIKNLANLLDKVIQQAGLPSHTITCMTEITDEGIKELIQSPNIDLVINLGNCRFMQGTIPQAKPIYYCGTGSTPVFIERTANIAQAVSQIITSREFDNGLLPAAEQFVITESVIANQVRHELVTQGAYFLTDQDQLKLADLLDSLDDDSEVLTGQSVQQVATRAGFSVPAETKLLVCSQDYINAESPLTETLNFPIIVFYLEPDWLRACEKCMALLKNKHHGHTLAIHSNNADVIREFALKKPVARVIVNNAASLAALGIDSDLEPTLWLGGLTTGGGSLAKGFTPKDLTYVRQVGYPAGQQQQAVVKQTTGQTTAEQETDLQAAFLKVLSKLVNESD
ncbi:aldehyde dehydrogenase family protein [Lacticaseibacillus baoqingensis]|uniref:Aldehyde dehydrogenase family protein n=1 Tax=Lacticaseibacillus baoqingensis TaxID=2486013 RepID=A0ABW4EBB1_9LACO|nr:aldehyde dehydrogenase family protein [Lacticaseibacillus baoqingensis]